MRPTRYPVPMPSPSVMMSVALVGLTAWPSASDQPGHGSRWSEHTQHVVAGDRRPGPDRQLVAAAEQRANAGAVRRRARAELVERLADELTIGHDDVGLVDVEVPCLLVRHLRTETANVVQERRNLAADRQQIAFLQSWVALKRNSQIVPGESQHRRVELLEHLQHRPADECVVRQLEHAHVTLRHAEIERFAGARQRVALGPIRLFALLRGGDRIDAEHPGQIADEQHDSEHRDDVGERIAGGDIGFHLLDRHSGRQREQPVVDHRGRGAHDRADGVAPRQESRARSLARDRTACCRRRRWRTRWSSSPGRA